MTPEQAITIFREHTKDIVIAIDTVVEHFADVSKSSLTWQDIEVIVKIADEVITKEKVEYGSMEEYYSEVLKRYQEESK